MVTSPRGGGGRLVTVWWQGGGGGKKADFLGDVIFLRPLTYKLLPKIRIRHMFASLDIQPSEKFQKQ